MTPELLYAEAEKLARSSYLLKATGSKSKLAAVWHASEEVEVDGEVYFHCLSVDTAWLPKKLNPGMGCLSLYLDEESYCLGIVRLEQGRRLEHFKAARALYAHQARSLPPLEAIMRFGSARVEEWLDCIGSSRTDQYAPNTTEAQDYIQLWLKEHPLYQDDIFAVIGGWHFPWGYGDWGELLEHELMFWTLEDAEPWFEVWQAQNEFQVLYRVT